MNRTPEVTTPEVIQRRSGYQSMQPVRRPEYWGVDLDPARRPGVPMERTTPEPMLNTRFPLERQPGKPAVPMHGRSNKTMPPVFGTEPTVMRACEPSTVVPSVRCTTTPSPLRST